MEGKLLDIIRKKLQEETLLASEQKKWEKYISNDNNRLEFEQLQRTWRASANVKMKLDVDTQKAWQRFITKENPQVRWYQNSWLRIAASVVILFATALTIYLTTGRTVTLETYAEEVKEFTLPDGSTIWLNENSKVVYDPDFNKERKLSQEKGEVFYEVHRDTTKPFIVNASSTKVQVLGTSFNIETTPEKVDILVKTGRVAFIAEKDSLVLEKNDVASWNSKSKAMTKSVNPENNTLAWQTKTLVFDNDSLSEVIKELETYFDITIVLSNPAIGNCKFTSTFKDPKIEEVLKFIGITLDLQWGKISNSQYNISGKACE
ncbi:FecR domain-containing protein [Aquimarina sp. MMG016]|uniref:FecR family protein n=1 Tax=Aquimarina sp. MMG016 TaxID=2822690 RepID=UPI001B3A080D|nr:FecR domain-containing protein [Aquimarina sp. MMG016]MBQ4822143.1 FecR domain-containing protein [Aquimarina sp. MMG016]